MRVAKLHNYIIFYFLFYSYLSCGDVISNEVPTLLYSYLTGVKYLLAFSKKKKQ